MPNASLPFTRHILDREQTRNSSLQTKWEKIRIKNRNLQKELIPLCEMRRYGLTVPAGQVPRILNERMSNTAMESGASIRSMSDIQRNPIADGIAAYTLNISAECRIGELEILLKSFSEKKPRLYWKSLRIRPSSPRKPELLSVEGQLSVLNFEVAEKEK